jgi:hypothetical protein
MFLDVRLDVGKAATMVCSKKFCIVVCKTTIKTAIEKKEQFWLLLAMNLRRQ